MNLAEALNAALPELPVRRARIGYPKLDPALIFKENIDDGELGVSAMKRGEPLRDYETIVNLISRTTTAKGLQVTCRLDRRKYPTGRKVTDEEIRRVNLQQNKFHGEWNYTIHPSPH